MDNTVRVLSTLALKGAVRSLAGPFEVASGLRIDADFAPTLALLDRLRGGEGADVVILTREGLDELAREGRVVADSCVDSRAPCWYRREAGAPSIYRRNPHCAYARRSLGGCSRIGIAASCSRN
jgi:molybdate transport system substrate-binding protein